MYTLETGESQLLLCLYGSIPSAINGKVYKIPIELWVPHEYPIVAPFVYVVPTEKMVLQPGNHVDNSGRCYLPYLANWGQNPEDNYAQSNIVKLCEALSKIFSNEPPVFAKPITKTTSPPSQISQPSSQTQSPAPALPPKPRDNDSGIVTPTSPPPLPPLPEELRSRTIGSPTLQRFDHLAQQRSIDQARFLSAEQPNIMDIDPGDRNGHGENTERLQVLSQLDQLLQQVNQFEVTEDLNKMNSNISKIKYSIGKFDKIFQYEFHNLEKTNHQLEENKQILESSIVNAQQTIEVANSHGDVNVDEVICAETVVFNQ